MSLVDDILTMNSAESRCSINGDTRDIVVPDEYHIFGVESDENVTRIPFICPKIVGDNVDLTGYSLYINYINGAGLGGIYVVDDVVTNGDNITFSWLLSRNVTAKSGTVSYIICAKKSGTDTKVTNEWNTKIATGTVSSGIETYDTVAQQSSDVINKLLKLTQGQSAYDIAIDNGFVGTKAAWLESLKGTDGKSAYQYAQDGGYTGTEAEFAAKLAAEGLDKALYVVNITANSDGTFSADKTFEEIKQVYDEGKYYVVAVINNLSSDIIIPANIANIQSIIFSAFIDGMLIVLIIGDDNTVKYNGSVLATESSKLPNPYPLTFTGAVTGSYDGSAPLSVEIPQGGGGALSGLSIADNYDIELISQVIIDQGNIPTAGITVTQKDDGSPFAYDGLLIWSDAKSSGSYTTFNFNGYTNYPIAMTHGDKSFLNLYITDGVTMLIVNGKDVRYIIKQSHADTGNLFYPDAVFQRVPEKFTSFKIGADGIASVKFYKAWGLTRK